jgi:hypothetical protein
MESSNFILIGDTHFDTTITMLLLYFSIVSQLLAIKKLRGTNI